MRSRFGIFAQRLRADRNMSQTDFSEATGWSLSRISNIEFRRAAISDDVLRIYLHELTPNGSEAHELRKLAQFSNTVRRHSNSGVAHPPLQAMLEQFGSRLSPQAVAKIQSIVERETGEQVSALQFSSNRAVSLGKRHRIKRPPLSAKEFVRICHKARKFRQRFAKENEKLKIGQLLETLAVNDPGFDYKIVASMPSIFAGAFACIIGEINGHTLVIEEKRFLSSEKGVYFTRHVLGHEIGHHVLHKNELKSDGHIEFAPQELAKNSSSMMETGRQIEQVVDTKMETEAECFATFLLVPWEAFMKGTHIKYLAQDYGEQPGEIERYMKYFKQNAVVDAMKMLLWEEGERSHPIFSHSPL